MKKKLFSTLLLFILVFSFNMIVHAEDTRKDTATVDLSSNIIQSGGLLPQETDLSKTLNPSGISFYSGTELSPSTYSSNTYKKVEAALLKAFASFQTSVDLSNYKISQADFIDIYTNVLNNNHRYFYVSGSVGYGSYGGHVTYVNIYYRYDKTTAKNMQKKYDSAISLALSGASDNWSGMEKALYINDYLAQNCEYDGTLSKFTAYNALVEKTAVCQGYALAYKALATELGLDCQIVTSRSLNHAWNMVEVDDKFYHIGTTWNDPTGSSLGEARHNYFLKSTACFQKHHLILNDWTVTGGWKDSYAKTTTFDTHLWDTVKLGFHYVDGYWYTFDGNDIIKYKCNGNTFTKIDVEVPIDYTWYVMNLAKGYSGYYYDKYTGVGSYGDYLYYSSPDTIYKYDVSKRTSSIFYELTNTQKGIGQIYGLQVAIDGSVYYDFSVEPYSGNNASIVSTKAKGTSTYSIMFKGNGATSGSMSILKNCKYGTTYKLTANKFKRKNYVFTGWNTKANGKGKTYKNKANVKNLTKTNGKTITLYAQWQKVGINTKKKTIYVGSSYTLKLTGTTIKSTSSSNKKVATVSKKGKVSAKKAGKATITLKGKNGKKYKCTVTVKKPYINAKKKTLKVRKSFTLKLTGTTIKKAVSSNKKVATVSKKGKVTAKKAGKATITLKGKDGKLYKCKITVKK